MIIVHTKAGRFAWPSTEHTYTVHGDGDLTVSHHQRGMVAVVARGEWVIVTTALEATR